MIEALRQDALSFRNEWTLFVDSNSGGYVQISPWEYIVIELPLEEAIQYFILRFGRDPRQHSCNCGYCGQDYDISEYDDLAKALKLDSQTTTEQYIQLRKILICAVDGKINNKIFEKFDFLEDLNRKNENAYL